MLCGGCVLCQRCQHSLSVNWWTHHNHTTDNFVTFLHSFGWSTADGGHAVWRLCAMPTMPTQFKCELVNTPQPHNRQFCDLFAQFWLIDSRWRQNFKMQLGATQVSHNQFLNAPFSKPVLWCLCSSVLYVSTYVSPPVPNNHWLSPNRKFTLFFQQPSCHSAINTSRYSTHYSLYHPHTSDNVSWNMSMWIFTQSNYDRAKTFGHVFHWRPPFFFLNLSLGFAMKLILIFKFKFQCLYYLIQQRKTHTNWQKLKTNKQTNKYTKNTNTKTKDIKRHNKRLAFLRRNLGGGGPLASFACISLVHSTMGYCGEIWTTTVKEELECDRLDIVQR